MAFTLIASILVSAYFIDRQIFEIIEFVKERSLFDKIVLPITMVIIFITAALMNTCVVILMLGIDFNMTTLVYSITYMLVGHALGSKMYDKYEVGECIHEYMQKRKDKKD